MQRMQLLAVAFAALPTVALAQVLEETFDNADPAPNFVLLEDNPSALSLDVSGGIMNVLSNDPGANDDALWLSVDRLSAGSDFSMSIDYSLTGFGDNGDTGDLIGVALGIGRDLDGTDSAAVTVGFGNAGFATPRVAGSGFRVDDVEMTDVGSTAPATGSLGVSYVAATDVLTLTAPGYSNVLPGLVQGTWGASELIFSFGARGQGFVLNQGDASLDNFVISTGVIPEPATLAVLALPLALIRRR